MGGREQDCVCQGGDRNAYVEGIHQKLDTGTAGKIGGLRHGGPGRGIPRCRTWIHRRPYDRIHQCSQETMRRGRK